MCSTSKVNEALQGMTTTTTSTIVGGGVVGVVPTISAHRIQENRSDYFLVDIREGTEIPEKSLSSIGDGKFVADAEVTLGAICHDATGLIHHEGLAGNNKMIVLICPTGARAELAAKSILLQSSTTSVGVLQKGMVGLANIGASITPDFLVVLGVGGDSYTEKLSLSLAAVATAIDTYDNVVLVLMSNGVDWFVKPDSPKATSAVTKNVESVTQGEPFKPCKAMLTKFLSKGGLILACTTCVKHRGYSFETDMMGCVKPMQMPDLVRMLGEAKGGNLQFL